MSRDITIDTDAYRARYGAKQAREAMNVAYVKRMQLESAIFRMPGTSIIAPPRTANVLGSMINGRYVLPERLSLIAGHVLVQQEFLRGMFAPDTNETFVGLWEGW